jgi:hypothetical protein
MFIQLGERFLKILLIVCNLNAGKFQNTTLEVHGKFNKNTFLVL